MIISGKNKQTVIRPKTVAFVLFGILLLLAAFLFFSKKTNTKTIKSSADLIVCDAEQVIGEDFVNGDYKFVRANTRSDEQARSGQYASKLSVGEGFQYGFGHKLSNPNPGDLYKVSVWRYRTSGGKGFLVVAGFGGVNEFYKSEHLYKETEDSWELIEFVFSVPLRAQLKELSVYVYSEGKQPIYFDDLKIERLSKYQEVLTSLEIDTLQIVLEEKGLQKLTKKREEAFRNRILVTSETDWVNGRIIREETNNQKMKLRLKGDWLDHLQGDKWSFRIKMRGNEAWNRLRNFSVQTPQARYFLHEWVLHEFFKREDVLTTYYDFIFLDLNETSKGIYAVEAHFDKILLESNQRREGPIVKFREDGFWEALRRQVNTLDAIEHGYKQNEKDWKGSEVRAFGEKTILDSPALTEQFETAQNLLHQFQYGKPIEDVFDLERMAKYYAIIDAMGAYHGIVWHNQRFYYNPLVGKLEPIGYDGFADRPRDRSFFLGQGALNKARDISEAMHQMLFQNEKFTAQYIQYLHQFTSKKYLQTFFAEIEPDLQLRQALLQAEFDDYTFDEDECIRDAQGIHMMLLPQNNTSLKVYQSDITDGVQSLHLTNINSLPIELLGSGIRSNRMSTPMSEPLILPGAIPRQALKKMNANDNPDALLDTITRMDGAVHYDSQSPLTYNELKVNADAKYIFFRPLGLDTIFHSAIFSWSAPKASKPPKSIFAKAKMESNEMYRVSEGMVYFQKGKHYISEPLVFPEGLRIHFEAGTQLNLTNRAFFLSHSPVFMYGTETAPIQITSSDKSGRGFHIMETTRQSELSNVIFENLNTVNESGWLLTGAVTFYEANVNFDQCSFTHNLCEDALNLIRTEFTMNKCIISQTYADGLDADFCKGVITNSRFVDTGNDGVDMSGSIIRIENITVLNAGDKGLSIGEASDATVFSATIDTAPIAIAAKDLSTLLIDDINLINCRQGFTAFQKKPEYGGSKIVVNAYKSRGVKKLHNIQKGSTLQLEKRLVEGE